MESFRASLFYGRSWVYKCPPPLQPLQPHALSLGLSPGLSPGAEMTPMHGIVLSGLGVGRHPLFDRPCGMT